MNKENQFYTHQLNEKLSEYEEKYQHAINLLQSLLNAYGCKTKQWEEARTLIDLERPLIAKESKE